MICKCFVLQLNVAFLIQSVFVPYWYLYSQLSISLIIWTVLPSLDNWGSTVCILAFDKYFLCSEFFEVQILILFSTSLKREVKSNQNFFWQLSISVWLSFLIGSPVGVRYNAEKKKVGNYYTTPIYRFRMKCHLCDNHFEIETDPKVRKKMIQSLFTFNPLTPKIWLLIIPSGCYTFPCQVDYKNLVFNQGNKLYLMSLSILVTCFLCNVSHGYYWEMLHSNYFWELKS